MRKIILSALLILLAFPLLSQTVGNVSICVRDSVGKALPDAGVLFFRGDSLTAGIASGQDGCIVLSLDTGRYVVRVTHIGYEEYVRKIQLMPVGIVLRVQLEDAPVELDEVTVSEQTFSATLDRSSFKIPANVKRSSQDIYYLMATVPALDINPIERTAAIADVDNSIITVNNIRRDKSYLLMLKPKDIEQVEIIRSPSARYKGVDGIINIVLSERPDRGHSGYFSARPEITSFKQGYFDGGYSYTGEKVNVSLVSQYFFMDDNNIEESLVRDVSTGNGVIRTERTTKTGKSFYGSPYAGSNIDYEISSKTFVSFGLSYFTNPKSSERPYKGKVSSADGEYEYDALSTSESAYRGGKANLYFQTDFNKKSLMSIDIDYNFGQSESNSRYTEQNNDGHFYENRQINNSDRHTLTSQINFQQQLPQVRLEEGYRLYNEYNPSDNDINGVFTRTEYDRWLHYFYVSLLGNISKKLVYQVNTGFDISQVTFNGERSAYAEFTPNAMLRYIMKGGQNISLHYSLARKTPSSSMLSPVPQFVDSSCIITGNPNLKPYYLHSLQLRHEFNKSKFHVNTSLEYSRANNIASGREYLEDGVYNITYTNGRNNSMASAESSVSFSVFQWWKVSASGSVMYDMYENIDPDEDDNQPLFHKNFWRYKLRLSSNVNYKNLSLFIQYAHPFRNATMYGYNRYTPESNVNASYRLNNSWTIIGVLRYLRPVRNKLETYMNGFTEIYRSHLTERYFCTMIGIRYSFQTGKQQQHRQKKVKNYNDIVEGNASTR
jgi:hypothetical protein